MSVLGIGLYINAYPCITDVSSLSMSVRSVTLPISLLNVESRVIIGSSVKFLMMVDVHLIFKKSESVKKLNRKSPALVNVLIS